MGLYTMASPNGAQAPPSLFPVTYNLTLDEYHNYISDHYTKSTHQLNMGESQFQAPTSSSSLSSSSTSIIPSLPPNCNLNGNHKVLQDIESPEEQENNEILGPMGDTATYGNFPLQSQEQVKWIQYEQQEQSMGLLSSSLPMFGNGSTGFSESQQGGIAVVSVAMAAANPNSSESQKLSEITQSDEIVLDKSKERRQKRMIKNRESAARSRAKKQAYINTLEDKVDQLESANKRLKLQLEMFTHPKYIIEPKRQFRRASSAPL